MRFAVLPATTLFFSQAKFAQTQTRPAIWISAAELANLPTSGAAWNKLKAAADSDFGQAKGGHDDNHDVYTFGQALVAARLNDNSYRAKVADNLMSAIGTENNGNALSLSRNLLGYVLAADEIDFPDFDPVREAQFREWLRNVRYKDIHAVAVRSGVWHYGLERLAGQLRQGHGLDGLDSCQGHYRRAQS